MLAMKIKFLKRKFRFEEILYKKERLLVLGLSMLWHSEAKRRQGLLIYRGNFIYSEHSYPEVRFAKENIQEKGHGKTEPGGTWLRNRSTAVQLPRTRLASLDFHYAYR